MSDIDKLMSDIDKLMSDIDKLMSDIDKLIYLLKAEINYNILKIFYHFILCLHV